MTDPRCPDHAAVSLQPRKKGWYCPECDDVVLTFDECPREGGAASASPTASPSRALVDALPTLLASPLVEGLNDGAPQVALWALADAAEVALKLVVMAGVGEHLREGAALPDGLVAGLRDHVELPTMGRWMAMARAVAKHAPSGSPVPLAATVEGLGALLGGAKASETEGLLAMRNRLAHGGAMGRAEASRLLGVWRPRVEAWAGSLGWLTEASLVAVDAGGQRVLLRGVRGSVAAPDVAARVPADVAAGSTWLCVGDRALPLGPLGAFDLGAGAPLLYVRSGDVRLEYLRLGEDGAIVDSNVEARERFRSLFVPRTRAAPGASRRFTIASFDGEIRHEAARRVGRERELVVLEAAARGLSSGALWLAGPAGIGKSNVMAALMASLVEAPPEGALVLSYRFRAGDDRCGRGPFLAYVRERLEASDAIEESDKEASAEAKPAPALDPVQEVRDLLARLRPGRHLLLVLDGLDEIAERDPRFVEDVLMRLRGAQVAVVAAGRPERGLPEAFARMGAAQPFPEGLPRMSEHDVRAMLLLRTGPARRRLLEGDHESAGAVHNRFVERVTERSEGLPIYVKYVIGDLNAGKLSADSTLGLPASLHAYHDELLRRTSIGDLQTVTTPTLVLLALSREPLTARELAALLRRSGRLATADEVLVEAALRAIGAMVRQAPDPDGEEGYTVFHHSLRTHVLGSEGVQQTVGALRLALADSALRPVGDAAEVYLYRCGVQHLLDADRVEDALGLVTDFDLLMARFQRLESTGLAADGWYGDWERVLARAGALDRRARAWWDLAQTSRHHYRKAGWAPWRVLFQAAMDHADDSPATQAAEAYEARDGRDWAWLRWVNRPSVWRESPCRAVMVGHTMAVEGAQALSDGRVLSWSGDGTLRLWDGPTGAPLAVLEGHAGGIRGAQVLPDGRVLSWSEDGTLRLWDGATGAPLAVLEGHTYEVLGAQALPDGRVLSWSGDGTLRLWDGMTGAPLAVLEGHTERVVGAQVLPDGRLLSWSNDGTLRLWDGMTGAPLAVLKGHRDRVYCAQLLPDGRVLSWSGDGTLRLWDGATGAPLAVLEGHKKHVLGVRILPDGRLLSWSLDHTLRLWDGATGVPLAVLEGHTGKVLGTQTLPDGRVLSWSWDRTLRLWDGTTGMPLAVLEGHTSHVYGAEVLPDGRVLSWSLDPTLRLWDSATGSPLAVLEGHTSSVRGARALPDGRLLSWSGDGTLRLWDGASGVPLALLEGHTGKVLGTQTLPDRRLLSWSGDGTLRLWDAVMGAMLVVLEGHRKHVLGVRILPDGRLLSWSLDHTLRLWDGATGVLLAVLEGHTGGVTSVQELSDGRLLSWADDATLRLWDSTTGAPLAVLAGHTRAVRGARALPDGRVLSWSDDHTLRLWDGASGVPLAVLEGRTGGVTSVQELSDGRLLSWADDATLRLWDSTTGAPLAVLAGHTRAVRGARALPDGRVLSWSEDRTLRFWDGATGVPLAVLEGHTGGVTNVQELSDGRVLSWSGFALSGWDCTLRLWDGTTGAPLAVLEGHAGRVNGARELPDGRLLSWSWFDQTLRLWDGTTGAPLALLDGPATWSDPEAEALVAWAPAVAMKARARHHSLHTGFDVTTTRDDLAVFSGGRHLRLTRFVAAGAGAGVR